MKAFYQISDNIALPRREDNLLRLCFEPYKVTKSSLLQGLGTHDCVYGGKQDVGGTMMFYCKLGEKEGRDASKVKKVAEIKYKVQDWVIQTEAFREAFAWGPFPYVQKLRLPLHSL